MKGIKNHNHSKLPKGYLCLSLFFIFLFSSLTDMHDTLKMLLVKAIDLYTKFMAYDFISWYMGRYVKCISDRMNA